MNDLVAKIRAALDEKQATAWQHHRYNKTWNQWSAIAEDDCAGIGNKWEEGCDCGYPRVILREVTAMRKILDIHCEGGHGECNGCNWTCQQDYETPDVNQCPTLLALAEALGVQA